MTKNKNETYLGDGVYATFNGYSIVLDLRMESDHRIRLEPAVLARLNEFADSFKAKRAKEKA